MAHLGGVLALAGAPGRPVRLERHLYDDGAADSPGLRKQDRGIRHMLQHVGEDAQVERAVPLAKMQAVVELH